jgi:hypothetical protein
MKIPHPYKNRMFSYDPELSGWKPARIVVHERYVGTVMFDAIITKFDMTIVPTVSEESRIAELIGNEAIAVKEYLEDESILQTITELYHMNNMEVFNDHVIYTAYSKHEMHGTLSENDEDIISYILNKHMGGTWYCMLYERSSSANTIRMHFIRAYSDVNKRSIVMDKYKGMIIGSGGKNINWWNQKYKTHIKVK